MQIGASPGRVHRVLKERGVKLRPAGFRLKNRKGQNLEFSSPAGEKQCTKCLETKPVTAFNKGQPDSPDGLFYWCKECRRAYNRAHLETHRESILLSRRLRRETHPWPYAAGALVRSDVRRGHRQFSTPAERVAAIRELTGFLKCYPNPEVCGVHGCAEPATEWDEIRHGEGHVAGNIGRLCFRHNRLKNDASVADLDGLLVYMRG